MIHSYVRILLAFVLLGFSLMAKAADDVLLIVQNVGDDDRDSTYIELSTNPKLTFGQNSLMVSTGNLVLDYANIVSISFVDKMPPPIVTEVFEVQNDIRLRFDGPSMVTVLGLPGRVGVGVFSVDGRKISADVMPGEHYVSIDLANQPNGVYIIKVGTKSFKITKR